MSDKQIYADAKILGELVAQKITVNGEYSLPLTDGSAGQVFATDGAGNISLIDVNTLALTHDNILDGTGITWEYDSMTHTFQGTVTLAPFSTTDLPEGDNLYYSDEKVDDRVKDLLQSAIVGTDATNPILWEYDDSLNTLTPKVSLGPFTTDNLSQGATNKYFSNELVDDRVNDLLQDGQVGTSGTPLVWNYNDIAGTLTPVISLAPFDTDALNEGETNLYYQDIRVETKVVDLLTNSATVTWSYNALTHEITANAAGTPLEVLANGDTIGTHGKINFIEGSNITLDVTNDALNNKIDVVINADIASAIIDFQKAGSLIGSRGTINFIEGSNVAITVSDNSGSDRVDVTIASTAVSSFGIYDYEISSTRYDDFTVPTFSTGTDDAVIRITASGIQNTVISGIVGGVNGRRIILENDMIDSLIILEHYSAGSTSGNGFWNSAATAMFVRPGEALQFIYNPDFEKGAWILVGEKNYNNQHTIFDDMFIGPSGGLPSTTSQQLGSYYFTNGGGTSIQNVSISGVSNFAGLNSIINGTVTGNFGVIANSRIFNGLNITNGHNTSLCRLAISPTNPGLVNNGTDLYSIATGFADLRFTSSIRGVYWKYDNTGSNNNWYCVVNNGTISTAVKSIDASSNGTNLGIFISRAIGKTPQACFYYSLDGQTWNIAATITSTFPSGGLNEMSQGISVRRLSTVGTAVPVYVDFLAHNYSGNQSGNYR